MIFIADSFYFKRLVQLLDERGPCLYAVIRVSLIVFRGGELTRSPSFSENVVHKGAPGAYLGSAVFSGAGGRGACLEGLVVADASGGGASVVEAAAVEDVVGAGTLHSLGWLGRCMAGWLVCSSC